MQRKPVDSSKVETVAGNGGLIQSVPVNAGEVELEWLEIPAHIVTEHTSLKPAKIPG